MNPLYNQMLNPDYVNQDYYYQHQQEIARYQAEQSVEVEKAVKAIHDFCEAAKKIDPYHQQEAFLRCLSVFAVEFGW